MPTNAGGLFPPHGRTVSRRSRIPHLLSVRSPDLPGDTPPVAALVPEGLLILHAHLPAEAIVQCFRRPSRPPAHQPPILVVNNFACAGGQQYFLYVSRVFCAYLGRTMLRLGHSCGHRGTHRNGEQMVRLPIDIESILSLCFLRRFYHRSTETCATRQSSGLGLETSLATRQIRPTYPVSPFSKSFTNFISPLTFRRQSDRST